MPTFASESFTGADATALATHNASWVKVTGFTGTAQLQSNRLRGAATTDACAYRYDTAPGSADYEVASEFQVVGTTSTAFNAGVLARASSSTTNAYMARWRNGTGFQLFKFVGSITATQIGSTVAQSYSAGTTQKIRLKVEGSTISVFRGDETTAIITVTDTAHTAAGFAGVWTNVNSNTDGPHLDNWLAYTSGAAAVLPTGIASGEAFGTATVAANGTASVLPTGIPSAEAFGTPYVADNAVVTADGMWTWFTEPRAVFHNGAYYVGWINSIGDAGVTKVVSATGVKSSFTLKVNLQQDDHNNPAIYIRPDGRVMCFYGKHNDPDGIRYRVSTNPEDISSFAAEVVIAPATLPTCYSNPRYLSAAGRLFYHYRAGNSDANRPHSIISTADFSTWTSEIKIFDAGGAARPYVKSASNGVDRIDFFLTNCHPVEGVASVYHAYALWDAGTSALKYYTSAGVELTLPIDPASCTLIKSGTPHDNWVWDISYGSDGHPRVLYTRFNGTSDHRYEFSRWNGSAWTTPTEVCTGGTFLYSGEPYYSGGMCFDGNDRDVVYVSRQVSSQWEIQEYRTADSGATWAFERSITSGSSVKNCRPYSADGHDGTRGVLWWSGTYTTYISYNTSIRAAESFTAAVVVTATQTGAWSVRSSVATSQASAWSVRNLSTATQAGAFSVRNLASALQAGAWSARNLAAATQAGAWSVANAAGTASALQAGSWSVRNLVAATQPASWSVRNRTTTTAPGAWSVRSAVAATQAGAWKVSVYAAALQGSSWTVRNYAGATQAGAWSVGGATVVSAVQLGAWSIRNLAGARQSGSWRVAQPEGSELPVDETAHYKRIATAILQGRVPDGDSNVFLKIGRRSQFRGM